MVNLPGLENKVYWQILEWWAKNGDPKSDGCSGVKDYYIQACWEHDFHYRYGQTIYKEPITFEEANERFRQAIQMRSRFKWFSPMSWWRWLGVKTFGRFAWNKSREINRPFPYLPLNPEEENV